MTSENALGGFLRARRELIKPEDVGIATGGRRRVPGLRREELAMLAGISTDYYLRLEQGRDRNPSDQIISSLAGALMLDEEAAEYLRALAVSPPPRRRVRRRPGRVPVGIDQLVRLHLDMPSFVHDRYMNVISANSLAEALSPCYRVGTNVLRTTFLNPEVRELYEDWERTAHSLVASVRALASPDLDDPQLAELVGDLSIRSEDFRRLWARHDVRARTSGTAHLLHPQVGPVSLNFQKLEITGTDRQIIVIYHVPPGSDAAERLALLANMAATTRQLAPVPAGSPTDRQPG
ncbi:helix-turn-helix transcriptional regulator [Streptomyces sp. NPDC001083]|uniref:helix-turn-helix transcriptional regulator n=1 Tax=Streptomyces sp. NPDC001083 TaxID=3364545 RepID=UPI0036BD655D